MITRKGLRMILLVTFVGIALVRWAQVAGPHARQMNRLSLARLHADKYQPLIKSDARFKSVRLDAYTGEGGCFMVHGVVATTNDLEELKREIEATEPPVPTQWRVRVIDTP